MLGRLPTPRWWHLQLFFGMFTPKNWVKMNPFFDSYVSNGLKETANYIKFLWAFSWNLLHPHGSGKFALPLWWEAPTNYINYTPENQHLYLCQFLLGIFPSVPGMKWMKKWYGEACSNMQEIRRGVLKVQNDWSVGSRCSSVWHSAFLEGKGVLIQTRNMGIAKRSWFEQFFLADVLKWFTFFFVHNILSEETMKMISPDRGHIYYGVGSFLAFGRVCISIIRISVLLSWVWDDHPQYKDFRPWCIYTFIMLLGLLWSTKDSGTYNRGTEPYKAILGVGFPLHNPYIQLI